MTIATDSQTHGPRPKALVLGRNFKVRHVAGIPNVVLIPIVDTHGEDILPLSRLTVVWFVVVTLSLSIVVVLAVWGILDSFDVRWRSCRGTDFTLQNLDSGQTCKHVYLSSQGDFALWVELLAYLSIGTQGLAKLRQPQHFSTKIVRSKSIFKTSAQSAGPLLP